MDKQPIHKSSLWERFITGRGFYIALAVCLLAIGGVAVATLGNNLSVKQSAEESSSKDHAVEKQVSDQPDDRTTVSSTTPTTATTSATITKTTSQKADLYILPMGNLVQREYSGDRLAYSVTMKDWRVHNGTDFAGQSGQTVKALADGTVSEITEDVLWGQIVKIDHGMDVFSTYCGVTSSLKKGDSVKVGDTIGTLSIIPCESAQESHLHLEMTVKGTTVDPVETLGRDVRYENDEEEESD